MPQKRKHKHSTDRTYSWRKENPEKYKEYQRQLMRDRREKQKRQEKTMSQPSIESIQQQTEKLKKLQIKISKLDPMAHAELIENIAKAIDESTQKQGRVNDCNHQAFQSSLRLSPKQRQLLEELIDDGYGYGKLIECRSEEWRSAKALERKGLIEIVNDRSGAMGTFEVRLKEEGL